MDDKVTILLKRLNVPVEKYVLFEQTKLLKIVVSKRTNEADVFLTNPTFLSCDMMEYLEEGKQNLFPTAKRIDYHVTVDKQNLEILLNYFPYFLSKCKDLVAIPSMFEDCLRIREDDLLIEVLNQEEMRKMKLLLPRIQAYYQSYGYEGEIALCQNEENHASLLNEIKDNLTANLPKVVTEAKETEKEAKEEKLFRREKKSTDPNCILGRVIKEDAMKIRSIVGEDNNIVVDAYVFATEYFESSKSSFKIITLKITDYSDSIYCKVFVRDEEEYGRLKKELKAGNWFRIRGYTKNDTFAKELVLNARDINKIDAKEEEVKDIASTKRIELHAHTMMSQMDGVADETKLVKQAMKWGHRAIAITDHNGVQAFPHVYQAVKDFNKGKAEDEKFKAIYGTELTMIDDNVDIVTRPSEEDLLETTYVVFDFETTGFNAGGADSIIEVGAVKIRNGEILEHYDELINPGKSLNPRITEVTSITDEMLKDKDTEENAIKRFIEWFGDCPMVAHNAKFDVSFLEMAYHKYQLGEFKNTVIDTLELSRTLDTNYARHSLSALVKRYEVPFDEESHHRGDYDAEATALVFHRMLKKLSSRNFETIRDIDKLVSKEEIHKYGRQHHVNILAKNKIGLKNLFRLVSLANTKYLYKTPRILRSELEAHREGLFIGSGCYESEIFKEAKSKSDEELTNLINFYDYVEVQPPECYVHMLESSDFGNEEELLAHLKKIVRLTKEAGKLIVATGDVHHLSKEDKIYREIIINQKVPGGGRHPLARYQNKPSNHFRTTDEMLENFSFLGEEAFEIVVTNPNKLAEQVEEIEVIVETGGIPFSPKIENSVETVKDLVFTKAHSMYGEELPKLIGDRIDQELNGIIKGGFDVIYLIAQKLVKHSNDDGYLVGSRGSVGSSFVATMMGITEVNPLPPHYLCPACKMSIFEDEEGSFGGRYSSGYDLPDKVCPTCGEKMGKEGQDMPFATFLGFNADKVPDIDLNFSGDYQWKAHDYTKVLFGVDNVYRAGTIGTVAEKTAYGYVKGYFEDQGIENVRTAEIERLALGCTGVKRTTGQHPGGIVVIPGYMEVFDFTPFQYPADDNTSLWRTTHFDYHAIDQDVLKLDILGHDDPTVLRMLQDLSGIDVTTLPPSDPKVLSLLRSPEALGVTSDDIMCPTGTLGLPELGTRFVIQMLVETKPETFGELVKISGLSHGTDVWAGNASELIKNNVVPFKDVIGCRDDIMVNLINWGVAPKTAFKIMEFVRKGRASKDPATWKEYEEILREHKIPEWYISSCKKIKYMFPKAHACAYVLSALRVAWFKVYKPLYYYAAYFSVRTTDFDIETMIKGHDAIRAKLEELQAKGFDRTNKEEGVMGSLEIALEASCRGIHFANLDLTKSDAKNFVVEEETNTLVPPFRTIDGLGDNVASLIVEEREKQPFLSIEDVQSRGKVSKTLVDKMLAMGVLNDLPESNQLSLF